jgi:hypothetical protein
VARTNEIWGVDTQVNKHVGMADCTTIYYYRF